MHKAGDTPTLKVYSHTKGLTKSRWIDRYRFLQWILAKMRLLCLKIDFHGPLELCKEWLSGFKSKCLAPNFATITFFHKASFSQWKRQTHFARRALFHFFRSTMPRPPSSRGSLTFSHLRRWILSFSLLPAHKNFLKSLSSVSATLLGMRKKERKYVGRFVRVACIRVRRPPFDAWVCFQLNSLLSTFCTMGSQKDAVFGLPQRGEAQVRTRPWAGFTS